MHTIHPIRTEQTMLVNVDTAFTTLTTIYSLPEGVKYKITACFESVNSRNNASDVGQITYQIVSSFSGIEAQGQGYISNINTKNSYNTCTITAVVALPPGNNVVLRCACTESGVMQSRVIYTIERWSLS